MGGTSIEPPGGESSSERWGARVVCDRAIDRHADAFMHDSGPGADEPFSAGAAFAKSRNA